MKKTLKISLLFGLLIFVNKLQGQLTTSTAMSPTELVQDVLVGEGVEVSGVTYTGDFEAIGSFNGASTNLGLNSGIILTTGTVKNEVGGLSGEQRGPFGPNNTASAGKANGQPGYGPLTALAGVATENAAVLEFDFVPLSNSVSFRYVFGSEEYPEFIDEGFNDVFAFFISGPGFSGTFNMAQIPGTGGPVSIDNINNGPTNSGPCQNCAFYTANGTGTTSPMADSDFFIQYDGFTVVMEATAEVECGETYHLQIAIADAGDQAYDSGIFLEANSLESFTPISIEADLALDGFGDGKTLAEGCETATITVSRTDADEALVIPVVLLGDATEGVDYENVPDQVSFAPGQTSVSFDFDVFNDAIIEGTEDLIIELNHPDPCGMDNFVRVELQIRDVDPLVATVEDVEVHCPGEEVDLTVTVSGGLPEYSYNWDTGSTSPTITVNPDVTTTYDVTVNDICIGIPVTTSGTVIVPVYPPLGVNTTDDITVLCPNTPNTLAAEPFGGEGTYSYEWTSGGLTISSSSFIDVSPFVTTTYTVTITDGCGNVVSKNVTITVTASVLELEMSPDQLICPGDTAEIFTIATEGLGDYTYYWLHSGETTSNVFVAPTETTTYTVSVMDACATYDIKGSTTIEVVQPIADFEVLSSDPTEGLLVSFDNTSIGAETWEWDLGNGETSTLNSPSTVYNPYGWYEVTLIAFNEIGCPDTAQKRIFVKPEFFFYAPNAFTPDDGRFNNEYGVSVIGATDFEFQIFNRYGELIYETTDQYFRWTGNYNGYIVPDNILVYKARVTDRETIVHEYEGFITILR